MKWLANPILYLAYYVLIVFLSSSTSEAAFLRANTDENRTFTVDIKLNEGAIYRRRELAKANKKRYIIRWKRSNDSKQAKESRIDIADLDDEEVENIKRSGEIEEVEEDKIVWGSDKTDSWAMDRIDQLSGLDGEYNPKTVLTGLGVTMYIVDSGVSASHAEFSNGNRVEFGINFADDATGKYTIMAKAKHPELYFQNGADVDCSMHGTHVGSLAAGKSVGVSRNAKIVPVRVLDCTTEGYLSDVIKGIKWSTDDALKRSNGKKPKAIINLSLTSPYSESLNLAVAEATSKGMVVVTAAGNEKDEACKYSPGSADSAITVGGINRDDSLYVNSNYGLGCVDIFAPAVNVKGASNLNDNGYIYLTGTSMASPIVAGVAGLLLERGVPSDQIKSQLETKSTKAVHNTDPDCSGYPDPDRIIQLPELVDDETPPFDVRDPNFLANGQDFTIWREDYSLSQIVSGAATASGAASAKSDICFTFDVGSALTKANKGATIAISSEVFPSGYKAFLASQKKSNGNTKCSAPENELSPTVFTLSLFPNNQSLKLGYGIGSGSTSAAARLKNIQTGTTYWIKTENKSGTIMFGTGNDPVNGTPLLTSKWATDKSKPLRFLSLSSTPKTLFQFSNIVFKAC